MTINEYQQLAMTTLNPSLSKDDVLINGVMGLCGESGFPDHTCAERLLRGQSGSKVKG